MSRANIDAPELALPKGGGVPPESGARVQVVEFRGGVQATIPVQIPPTRNGGLAPSLSLTYEANAGNGPFGSGFSIESPSISRSLARGVPTYTEADTILFSGAGPLVEKGSWSGDRWTPAERTETDPSGVTWAVREYLPRVQGMFPLIERWTRIDDRVPHWRVVTADDVEMRFGADADARIADPGDASRVYSWLLEEMRDAKGNSARYRYKAEDNAGVPPRAGSSANRYVERILYGNHRGDDGDDYAFEIVFDYGEYDLDGVAASDFNPYVPARPWPAREDPFSSYRPGFDLRTNRLCRAILVFNHFPAELGDEPCLTSATRLGYVQSPHLSVLASVTRVGYRRGSDGRYALMAAAPATFDYTPFDPPPAPRFHQLEVEKQADLPGYLAPGAYQPVDLDGEGIPGFLQSDGVVTNYYAPLGQGRYAAARAPEAFPDFRDLADPTLTLTDIDGDGRLELLLSAPTGSGFFQRLQGGVWGGFEPLAHVPTVEGAANSELVDLTGDGLVDVMTVGRTTVNHYPSKGTKGFARARSANRPAGFPSAGANAATERVAFVDMFGDGLAHRVRVIDGEVAVWPNLGHGRFGGRLTLTGAPSIPGSLSAARCQFADIDGTGAADLVIADSDRLLIYRNECGNGFSEPFAVPLPFRLGDTDQLSFIDVLGNGTPAIVVSRLSPEVEHWYCDLTNPEGEAGRKPHLMKRMSNGRGATTGITYRASTSFYLADKREGRFWPTLLPFPVQLLETLTVTDGVTGASTRQRFRYHDGYYDGWERVFRGFAYVESWSDQRYVPFSPAPDWPTERVNADLLVTPTYSRTWYETGAYFEAAALQRQYESEIYRGHPAEPQIPSDVFDPDLLTAGEDTARQARAALVGHTIRCEVYADDVDGVAGAPYVVTAANHEVALVQAGGPASPASVLVRDRETITYHYERESSDPRIEHGFLLLSTILEPTDGTYLERRCTVHYGRRAGRAATVHPEQQAIKAGVEDNWSTFVTTPFRMIGTTYAQCARDLGGLTPPASGGIYTFAEITAQVETALANEIPYGQAFGGATPQARQATHAESYFWNDDQTEALPLGRISARALLHHERKAVFSRWWQGEVFGDKVSADDLTGLAGLVDGGDGYWWNPGLIQTYFTPDQPELFFLPSGTVSPGSAPGLFVKSTIAYDAPYALLPVEVTRYANPATAIATTARYDYQALQPDQITNANGVLQQALYLPLALPLATSIFKPADGGLPRVGDGDLADYVPHPDVTLAEVLADPAAQLQQAGNCFYYDLLAWTGAAPTPVAGVTLARTRFVSDGVADAPIEIAITYSDAFGGVAETKSACEPEVEGGAERWITARRTVRDGKGEPAQTYFPFYTTGPEYLPQQALADGPLVAPPTIETRDPLGRPVRVATSKGFLTLTVIGAWETARHDEDDTIRESPFYNEFMANYPADPTQAQIDEKAALEKAVICEATPAREILDSTGHAFRRVLDNLGNVPPDHFAGIVSGDVTSAELWSALVTAGYLRTLERPKGTWVTEKFQPYTPGFTLTLPPPYDQFAAPAAASLVQSRLTTSLVVDQAGRLTGAADPRFLLAAVQGGPVVSSARFAYPMGSGTAALSDSADAGARLQLASFVGNTVLSFDAMGRRTQRSYDGLLRLLSTIVTGADGTPRTTQVLTYGDGQAGAAAANLIGEVWRIEDEAGTLDQPAYTILGQVAETIRRFAADYRTPPDWSGSVPLDPRSFSTAFTYDALRRVLTETTPDTSVITRTYWPSGRLASIGATLPGGPARPFVAAIGYAADDSRISVAFGNQTLQCSTYEATTGRLTAVNTTRPANGTRDPLIQEATYTYDPVGNVSIVRDRTARLLFAGGTEPEAFGDYGYDPIYQLVSGGGLQHPGIEADTHVTGFMQSLYAELNPPGAPPVTLETYTETYGYDLSGNLVSLNHVAASASFDRSMPVSSTSNRLAGAPYDANGNALATELTGTVPLTWTARDQLAGAGPFQSPDGRQAHNFYVYDFFGTLARRVVERGPDATAPPDTITDTVIIGTYTQDSETAASGAVTTTASLSLLDGRARMAVADTLSDGTREARFQLADRLGSISVETGADAGVLSYEAFYPYGGTSIIAGGDPAIVARKRWRYSGKPCEDDTGFYDYGARRFLPWQGRWLSADPAGTTDGFNLYRFVGGNPLTKIDPDGRNPNDPDDPDFLEGSLPAEFWDNFVQSALFAAINAPRVTFVSGPTNLHRLYFADTAERERARENARALRNETRLIAYNAGLYFGANPEWRVMRELRPESTPLLMINLPVIGSPFQRMMSSYINDPNTYGDRLGAYFGASASAGTLLAMARRFAFPNSRIAGPAWIASALIGFGLGRAGRREERERAYGNVSSDRRPYYNATGIPRLLAHTLETNERRNQFWQGLSNHEIALGMAVLVGFYLFAGGWAARQGQNMRDQWNSSRRGRGATTQQAYYQQPSALQVYRPPANALQTFRQQATALQLYRPPSNALQLYRPPANALQLFQPGGNALTAFGRQFQQLPRGGLAGVIAATAVGATALLLSQQNRNRKTGNE